MTDRTERGETRTDGLSFVPIKLHHLGGGDIAGDIMAEVDRLTTELSDTETFGNDAAGKITLTIEMKRDKNTIAIGTTIKVVPPTPKPKTTMAFATPQGLMVQPTVQLDIDSIRNAKRQKDGE